MEKEESPTPDQDMVDEYDFSAGVRGKYVSSYRAGTNLVLLSPDVAKYFPDSESVNEALRALIRIASRASERTSDE